MTRAFLRVLMCTYIPLTFNRENNKKGILFLFLFPPLSPSSQRDLTACHSSSSSSSSSQGVPVTAATATRLFAAEKAAAIFPPQPKSPKGLAAGPPEVTGCMRMPLSPQQQKQQQQQQQGQAAAATSLLYTLRLRQQQQQQHQVRLWPKRLPLCQ